MYVLHADDNAANGVTGKAENGRICGVNDTQILAVCLRLMTNNHDARFASNKTKRND